MLVGLRIVRSIDQIARDDGGRRRMSRPLLVAATGGVGFFTALLANGGGFLLVPLYVLVFGLRMRQAVRTSLVVIAGLAVPTLVTHWTLGHVDWRLGELFAPGLIPPSMTGGVIARRVEGLVLRRAFGWLLVAFAVLVCVVRLASLR